MARSMRPVTTALTIAVLLGSTALATAQAPPKASTRDMALLFLAGRWARPVTCELADGTHVDREEAIAFKVAPGEGAGRTPLRATFYGIEAPGALRCWNLVERNIADRRGVFYVHVRAFNRTDMGVADFRRMVTDGKLVYHVTRGQLRERPVGAHDDAWQITKLEAGTPLHVRESLRGSDAERLFRAAGTLPTGRTARRPRIMRFEIGHDPVSFGADFLEVTRRPRTKTP